MIVTEHEELPSLLEEENRFIRPNKTSLNLLEHIMVWLSYLVLFLIFPIAICFCLKTATVFERIVVFRLGKLRNGGILGPGLVFVLPCVDQYVKVDLRTRSFNVNPQEIITKDSVSIKVDAVVYYSIRNPLDSVVQISNVQMSTKLLAQSALRTVVGTTDLIELLASKVSLSKNIEQILDEATGLWGVKVERVEIKQIHLPKNMQRAMAAEQEADREAQAKITAAKGELKASTNLKAASDVMKSNPISLQLRYLQTLSSISNDNNHTIVFPFPLDIVRRIMTQLRGNYATGTGVVDKCCNDPQCCSTTSAAVTKTNKKLQTKPEKIDVGVQFL